MSELVTNAHQHGRPPVVLTVRRFPGTLRVDVMDGGAIGSGAGEWETTPVGGESGRGRGIVSALADRCGAEQLPGDRKSSFASWDVELLPVS